MILVLRNTEDLNPRELRVVGGIVLIYLRILTILPLDLLTRNCERYRGLTMLIRRFLGLTLLRRFLTIIDSVRGSV